MLGRSKWDYSVWHITLSISFVILFVLPENNLYKSECIVPLRRFKCQNFYFFHSVFIKQEEYRVFTEKDRNILTKPYFICISLSVCVCVCIYVFLNSHVGWSYGSLFPIHYSVDGRKPVVLPCLSERFSDRSWITRSHQWFAVQAEACSR